MEVSLGFLVVLLLILFPGVIIRRLYFYGEFSKQFNSGLGFIQLLLISSIPGLINLIFIFYLYDSFFSDIDLGKVIDSFKEVGNSNFKFQDTNGTPIKDKFSNNIFPFLGFLYLSSVLIGAVGGRLIRITRLDTKFKLLKFKNYWFYLFNNEHTKFKKYRHLKETNKKHLFTIADILIDTSSRTNLYSGVVVDYELVDGDCTSLSKVMLQDAKRYSVKENKTVPVKIPGNLLVVDCSSMKNINLTFVSEKREGFLKSKWPAIVDLIFAITILVLIPFFIFQTDYIKWDIYLNYFELHWFKKLIAFFITVQVLTLINPFTKNKDKDFEYVSLRTILAKFLWIIVLGFIFWWI